MANHQTEIHTPSLMAAIKVWAKIGILSFGGPAAQIALMHKMVVEEQGWLNEQDYLNALSFCMLLPGPEAMQLATYAGWRLHGWVGGLAAGLLFVLPGALVILSLAIVYALVGNLPLIEAIFLGVKAAVVIVVIESLLRIGKRTMTNWQHRSIAILAFVGIFFLSVPFPFIVIAAAAWGWFIVTSADTDDTINIKPPQKSVFGSLLTIAFWLVVWWLPILAFSGTGILWDIGTFFSKLAVVTFGGAYAVLAYMAQDVVGFWGWLSAGEMMDGLGLAETTPGPLILVTEFVGFLAAYKEGGILLGIAGALITLWVTFVPCFLWIFAGAPYIEWLCAQPRLRSALTAISAAVVGVILNLSVWFALHVVFQEVRQQSFGWLTIWQPLWSSLDWRVVVLVALCGFLAFRWHWSITRVLLISSACGIAMSLVG